MASKLSRVAQVIMNFDILTSDVRLTVGGKHHVPSKVGTCLSFVCLVLFSLLSYVSIASYFDTGKPKISTERTTVPVKPLVDLKKNHHYPILFFLENDSKYLEWSEVQTYFDAKVFHILYLPKPDGTDEPVRTYLKIVPCKELIARGKLDTIKAESEGYVKTYYQDFGFCIDDEDQEATLGGSTNSKYYESLNLYFFPCTLTDGSCKSVAELQQVSFVVANPSATVNLGNHNHPVEYSMQNLEFEGIVPRLFQTRTINVGSNRIVEDRGFMTGPKNTHFFTSIQQTTSQLGSRDNNQTICKEAVYPACIPYFSQSILLSNEEQIITRQYKGIVETIGEIGGSVKAVTTIFSIFYGIYSNMSKRKEFVKLIYGLTRNNSHMTKVLSSQLDADLDILRIVRELKVLKLLVLRGKSRQGLFSKEELFAEETDIFEFAKAEEPESPSESNPPVRQPLSKSNVLPADLKSHNAESPPLHIPKNVQNNESSHSLDRRLQPSKKNGLKTMQISRRSPHVINTNNRARIDSSLEAAGFILNDENEDKSPK